MLGLKISGSLSEFVFRLLPHGMACRVVRAFGLSTPMSPLELAYILLDTAGRIVNGLEKDLAVSDVGIKALDPDKLKAASLEVLAALYCLAVAVFAHNAGGVWAADQPTLRFQRYTATTFAALESSLEKTGQAVVFRQLIDECTELYLHDRPTLADFAKKMGDYIFGAAELQPALKKNDWNRTFYLKTKARVLWRLGLTKKEPAHLILSFSLGLHLLNYGKLFRQFRPASDETNQE